MALAQNETHRIILPGGELRLPDSDFINETVVQMFSGYRADYGFYGVGGIDMDGGLLDFHEPELRTRENIRRNSRWSILCPSGCGALGQLRGDGLERSRVLHDLLPCRLANHPPDLREAAQIEGASSWAYTRRIVLPLLMPTTLFVLIKGGPANASKLILFYIWESAFAFFLMLLLLLRRRSSC